MLPSVAQLQPEASDSFGFVNDSDTQGVPGQHVLNRRVAVLESVTLQS